MAINPDALIEPNLYAHYARIAWEIERNSAERLAKDRLQYLCANCRRWMRQGSIGQPVDAFAGRYLCERCVRAK